jgi:hypothetical protein
VVVAKLRWREQPSPIILTRQISRSLFKQTEGAMNAKRIPGVPPLSAKLPAGAEGGKEFSRIVNLLLFHDARKRSREISLFDDRAGDYAGLDAYEPQAAKEFAIGYQYKFFCSPLTDKHRSDIKAAIEEAAEKKKSSRIGKYVIITPDDLVNSGRRLNGGDVEWFDSLIKQYKKVFKLEHYGHTKITALFIQAPSLSLFYYPELVADGVERRRSFGETRRLYDANLRDRHGRIEFVGMSVYKEETSRRVPLEQIYIPLSLLPEESSPENDDTPRIRPTRFLEPNSKIVILGDPGSGKSTLISFLALCGISDNLQKRYECRPDGRLPIIVVLRRYADELKRRRNLSIMDYIIETVNADFNLDSLDELFLKFYLETGNAVLLFDGVDELPSSGLKSLIRDRIQSIQTSFPGNAIVVTSRLVGYEASSRFSPDFQHYRVARLRLDEIDRFIRDWYAHRIEDLVERERNAEDLVGVIRQNDNDAIRELARNPLILTIIALVHRIDAVLPDQRVVLYQKCTETLLNTWYKTKLGDDETVKGRVERRNRGRIEAIAHWMHCAGGSNDGRSVAEGGDLLRFLISHIAENETQLPRDPLVEDQAEEFLAFIRSKAGLLIEAGDGLYSFVHLTFQEYLTATWLVAYGEVDGAGAIWARIEPQLGSPRWHEVVRLLVASLKNPVAQKLVVDRVIWSDPSESAFGKATLLVGLIRDGIEPAEEEVDAILRLAVSTLVEANSAEEINKLVGSVTALLAKEPRFSPSLSRALERAEAQFSGRLSVRLGLVASLLGSLGPALEAAAYSDVRSTEKERTVFGTLIARRPAEASMDNVWWESLTQLLTYLGLVSAPSNTISSLGDGVVGMVEPSNLIPRLLRKELTFFGTAGYGPHQHHLMNLGGIVFGSADLHPAFRAAVISAFQRESSELESSFQPRSRIKELGDLLENVYRVRSDKRKKREAMSLFDKIRSDLKNRVMDQIGRDPIGDYREFDRGFLQAQSKVFAERLHAQTNLYWNSIRQAGMLSDGLIEILIETIGLSPKSHWQAALMGSLGDGLPSALAPAFDRKSWDEIARSASSSFISGRIVTEAAWLLLVDIWIWANHGYDGPGQSPVVDLAKAVENHPAPEIVFARTARDFVHGADSSGLIRAMTDSDTGIPRLLAEIGWSHS